MIFHLLNASFAVLFALSAALQYNDPDPIVWILVYGMAAVLCVVAARGLLPPRIGWLYAGLAAGVGVMSLAGGGGEAHMGWGPAWGPLDAEPVREALGMALVAGWMGCLAVRAGRRAEAEAEAP